MTDNDRTGTGSSRLTKYPLGSSEVLHQYFVRGKQYHLLTY